MRRHILNCFEITNANNLCVNYRLVDVRGPFDPELGDGDVADRNLQQLLKRIAYEERIPVAVCRRGRKPVVAIPAGHSLHRLEYDLAPDVASLEPREATEGLCLGKLGKTQQRIGLAFLGWELRSPLRRDGRLWSSSSWTYIGKRPLNYKNDSREVDVFGGFGLRVALRAGKPCVWVRLTHKYVESAWMLDVYNEHEIREKLRMRHLLYYYGHRWFPVQLQDLLSFSVEQQRFIPEGKDDAISVYDYTQREVGGERAPGWVKCLDRSSPAITYQYPGNKKKRYGAAALCKLMLRTDDPRVAGLHKYSIKSPERRFEQLGRVVQSFLQEARMGDEPIRIETQPMQTRRRVFSIPAQEFGQGQVLRVGPDESAGETRLGNLGRKRLELLLDPEGGVAVSSQLDAQWMLVPESEQRGVVEDFKTRLEKTVRGFLKRTFQLKRVLFADGDARTLKAQVEAILAGLDKGEVTSGRGVLMLPRNAESDLHNFVKKKLQHRLQFQCVDASKVSEFYELRPRNGKAECVVRRDKEREYVSYLRYAAMGVVLVNRQWPWVLAEDTHYDMYIGVDVLNGTAAFTFFSEGGRNCYLQSVETQRKEKLLKKQVRSVVYENLKRELEAGGRAPRSVIMRRDGQAYVCERQGFREAIKMLIEDGLLDKDVVFGVIEVHKTSAEGFRLVEEADSGQISNPRIGAWEPIDEQEGIVCNTGGPFRFPGTVKPLCVRIVAGQLNLKKVLEDTFGMSQLCWPVPDRYMRLSVDLKLCDDYLRSIAASADEDEGLFGEDEPEGVEEGERLAVGWNA